MLHNDVPLPLDEVGKADPKDVSKVVYTLSGGVGKSRAQRDGTLKQSHTWTTLTLSTGEMTIAARIAEGRDQHIRAGQLVRFIDIKSDAGKGFGAFDNAGATGSAKRLADEIKAVSRTYYGTAGPAFLSRLIEGGLDRGIAEARRIMGQFLVGETVPAGADGQVWRVADRFALVAAAGEMATALGIVPWQPGAVIAAATTLFRGWIEERGGTEPAEVTRAVEQVRRIIEQHGDARFDHPDRELSRPVPNRLGWARGTGEDRKWLIPPETWREEFCRGFDATMVARVLSDKGMLERGKGRHYSKVERIDGAIRRVYVLTSRVLGEEAEIVIDCPVPKVRVDEGTPRRGDDDILF